MNTRIHSGLVTVTVLSVTHCVKLMDHFYCVRLYRAQYCYGKSSVSQWC